MLKTKILERGIHPLDCEGVIMEQKIQYCMDMGDDKVRIGINGEDLIVQTNYHDLVKRLSDIESAR